MAVKDNLRVKGAGAMIQDESSGACGDRLLELQGFSDSLGGDEMHPVREEHVGGGVLGREEGGGRPRRVVQKPARYRD